VRLADGTGSAVVADNYAGLPDLMTGGKGGKVMGAMMR